ncbi:gluconeogenesis factor YvcK family protein [Sporosarcina trichiuri]|uniref:gluconeogenesis factor YvcK family protein n=1 Tax=Sporosarcina trichiuri TaxID=3056445 RepID=UPI0025B4BF45|nr:gluconeogenesis factor YvcK family protein [Sporosarcina sp. 0.2-SM1T-5]WJY27725.1 YvcK family protein [Sporosarcina sp. 0.2-SM1T-5]
MKPSAIRNKVVVFGGGTGLSTLLRGLKKHPLELTAVVTVADDGGSSGRLLDQYDIPPPGDVRKVMAALSDVEPLIEELFQYRFTAQDSLDGHSLGNLMLAAMTDITGDFATAIKKMGQVLNIKGEVLPAANERITLHAELEDGTIVTGESKIPMYARKIRRVYLSPQDAEPLPETLRAIREADLIIVGPGSLYTSILPSLLVQDIRDAVLLSAARKVYVGNLTTQKGETYRYTASEHVAALYDHVGEPFLDAVLLNSKDLMPVLTAAGQAVTSWPVECDLDRLAELVPQIVQEDIAFAKDGRVLHDADKVARWFMEDILAEEPCKEEA